MKKRILCLILVLSVIVSLSTISQFSVSAETGGTCGENLTWTLSDTGRLVISGEGPMTSAPWLTTYKGDIVEIKIRSGVTSIFKNAFNGCINLTEVDIADTVTTVEGGAFYKCEKLTSVYFPESVTTVGSGIFGYCTLLEEINFPEGVTVIGDSMFFRCLNLKKVTLPDTVETIEQLAFYACTSLEDIELKEGIKTIGREAFAFTAFENLIIPESVESIASSAFDYTTDIILNVYEGSYALEYAQKYDIPYVIIEKKKTPAELLCLTINNQAPDSCTVDTKSQTVTLLKDVFLTDTLGITENSVIYLDLGTFSIYGADDKDAISIPSNTALYIKGRGTVYGGNAKEGIMGSDAIYNTGLLVINGPILKGGDAVDEYTPAGLGLGFGWETLLIEGEIIAGRGTLYGVIRFEGSDNTVLKESDDGVNYTTVKEWQSEKRYIKGIKISNELKASEKLCAILNEIESGSCTLNGNIVKLEKDFICPHEICIPKGEAIVIDLDCYSVTTYDFYNPFYVPEGANITFKGEGVVTTYKKESSGGASGGVGALSALIINEGTLTVNGVTFIGKELSAIKNEGTLIINSGTIKGSDASSGKNAIWNHGELIVNGGIISGGNATREGNRGGDAVASMKVSAIGPGVEAPTKLNGGFLVGGRGMGDGENGEAISAHFDIEEGKMAYESDDGQNYTSDIDPSGEKRYLRVENTYLQAQNTSYDGKKAEFDINIVTEEQISGKLYVVILNGKKVAMVKTYDAKETVPVSVDLEEGQTIKVFWWESGTAPRSFETKIDI